MKEEEVRVRSEGNNRHFWAGGTLNVIKRALRGTIRESTDFAFFVSW